MALQTMLDNLKAARRAYQEQLAEITSRGKKILSENLGPMIPDGFCLQWNQYTPYFNDGEPCTFRVDDVYVVKLDPGKDREHISRHAEDGDEDSMYLGSGVYQDDMIPGLPIASYNALSEGWKLIPEDVLKSAFGDHARCRIFSDGTSATNEHDHD